MGLDGGAAGLVEIDGAPHLRRSVRESLRRGLVYVTEDRKREGLVPGLSCQANFSLPFIGRFARVAGLGLSPKREGAAAAEAFSALRVKLPGLGAPIRALSGGNQQKILFARWLNVQPPPGVVILDEPTRGVDVGAKAEIHRVIADLAGKGVAVW